MTSFTVLTQEQLDSVVLPFNFEPIYSDDMTRCFVSGTGYGIGEEFKDKHRLREFIYRNGWSIPTEE